MHLTKSIELSAVHQCLLMMVIKKYFAMLDALNKHRESDINTEHLFLIGVLNGLISFIFPVRNND